MPKYSTDIVLLNAGALLLMAPPIIVFLLLQKQFSAALLQAAEGIINGIQHERPS